MMLPAGPWLGQNDTKCLRGMKIPSTLTYTLKSYGIALESIPPILHPRLHKVPLLHGGNLTWKSLDSVPFAILLLSPRALWSFQPSWIRLNGNIAPKIDPSNQDVLVLHWGAKWMVPESIQPCVHLSIYSFNHNHLGEVWLCLTSFILATPG